jgi:hypothetical protein
MKKNQNTKVNIHARLNRHLRIVKETILNKTNEEKKGNFVYKIIYFLVIFILPILPTFSSVIYNTSSLDFYRGYINEESILESYYG